MSIGTFFLCGLAFVSGVMVGVVLGDRRIVTTDNLEQGGRYILSTTKTVANRVHTKIKGSPPDTGSAPTIGS